MTSFHETVEDSGLVWTTCKDCGSFVRGTEDEVTHLDSCVPGSSEYWRDYYEPQMQEL